MTDFLHFLGLVIAVEAATEILVDAKITDGFRAWLFRKAMPEVPEGWPDDQPIPVGNAFYRFTNDLLSCGYCTSVWVAFAAACFSPVEVTSWWVPNWLINSLLLHRLSNLFHIGLMLVKKGRVRTYDMEVTVKRSNDGIVGETSGPQCPAAGPQHPETGGSSLI